MRMTFSAAFKKERDTLSRTPDDTKTKVSIEEVRDMFSHSKYVFTKGTLDEQRLLVRSLIDYISINDDVLDFQWSFL